MLLFEMTPRCCFSLTCTGAETDIKNLNASCTVSVHTKIKKKKKKRMTVVSGVVSSSGAHSTGLSAQSKIHPTH